MSFASASLEQANIGNIGQIITGISNGVTAVANNTRTAFAQITVPPGTYILSYNYSIYDLHTNSITGIIIDVQGVNFTAYYVDPAHLNTQLLIPAGGATSGSNTIFIKTPITATYTVYITLLWTTGLTGPSVCAPFGGTDQNNYIYCLKVA